MQPKEVPLASISELSMPGVLVEILYLSNPQDMVFLSRQDFVESVSQALCDSILTFRSILEDKISFGTMSKM
jgi:N-acetylmuramoyl-L-alanine amidase